MFGDNKQIRDVAEVARKIMMGEKLHPNQQKLDVHEPEKDELTAADFKKLRSGKKPDMKKEEIEIEEESHQSKTTMKHIPNASPALKKAAKDIKPGIAGIRDRFDMLDAGGVKREHVENLDEVSLKTATSAYVKRMGKDDDKSPVKAVKTMDHIAKKHGVVGVARAAKAADKEYGLNDPVHNKRKDFVKGVMAGVKEEVEAIGVDISKLLYVSVDTVEGIFEACETIIEKVRTGDKDRLVTIVVDSVAAASSKKEMEADYDKDGYATDKAIIISKAMRKITNMIGRQSIALVFTNQLRQKMNAMFGDPWTTSGGKALAILPDSNLPVRIV